MLEDFFFRALLGGIGVAIIAGPVGCFIIWRRLAYFGDTLSHSALLGVAMALLLELNITLSVFFISLIVSLLLLLLQKRASLSSDALLGLLAHATLAVGLVVLAFMTWVRVDLMGFLFGDILAVTTNDLAVIWFGGLAVLIGLSFIWRRLFAATVNYELAKAEGAKPDFTNIVFMGMGEPLYNLDNVAEAIDTISHNEGVSFGRRRITVSTAGVAPKIPELGRRTNAMLAISLHAAGEAAALIRPSLTELLVDRDHLLVAPNLEGGRRHLCWVR